VKQNHEAIVGQFLSLLGRKEIEEYHRLKRMQPLSIKIEEVVVFLKQARQHVSL
jgi:hypothetical protein